MAYLHIVEDVADGEAAVTAASLRLKAGTKGDHA